MKKILMAIIVLMLCIGLTGCGEQKKYDAATALMNEGNYEEAIAAFQEIIDYEDASSQIDNCHYQIAEGYFAEKDYDKAIDVFTALGDYGDSAERVIGCKYEKAVSLYDALDFETALSVFKEIPDYKDVSDYIEKCEYELTTDGKFMRALADGLMKRWDYNESDEATKDSEDHVRTKDCDIELESVEGFYDQTFNDETLGVVARDYIDTVRQAKDSLVYYTVNPSKYSAEWSAAYAHRTILIEQLVNDYGLKVDENHQSTLNDLLNDAQGSKAQVALEDSIRELLNTIKIDSHSDEWGFVTYSCTLQNTTEFTFEYLYISVNAEDENGTIISSGSIMPPSNWAPGKTVECETFFSPEVDLSTVTLSYSANYTANNMMGTVTN